jgi:hypothetical protein
MICIVIWAIVGIIVWNIVACKVEVDSGNTKRFKIFTLVCGPAAWTAYAYRYYKKYLEDRVIAYLISNSNKDKK